jgi:DNA adenine methylase
MCEGGNCFLVLRLLRLDQSGCSTLLSRFDYYSESPHSSRSMTFTISAQKKMIFSSNASFYVDRRKDEILDRVIETFPRKIKNYHEPFLGGGSVLMALLKSDIEVEGKLRASDVNPHLINFFKVVRDDPGGVSYELCQLVDDPKHETPEAYYYYLRDQFNFCPTPALFLFLNRTCYRGLFRESKRGFNSPYGHYNKPIFPTFEDILAVSRLIQGVDFVHQGFEESLINVGEGDCVYCNPTYYTLSKTASFVDYTADGFDKHDELFSTLKALPCSFVMSNSDADVVLDSFSEDQYEVLKIPCSRSLKPGAKGLRVNEVLIIKQ